MIVQGQKKLENSKLLTFAQPARMGKNWQLFHSHINHCNLTIIYQGTNIKSTLLPMEYIVLGGLWRKKLFSYYFGWLIDQLDPLFQSCFQVQNIDQNIYFALENLLLSILTIDILVIRQDLSFYASFKSMNTCCAPSGQISGITAPFFVNPERNRKGANKKGVVDEGVNWDILPHLSHYLISKP